MLQGLQDEWEQIFQAWEQKERKLQAVFQEQIFLRKCGLLDQIVTAQEAGPLHPAARIPMLPPPCFLSPPFTSRLPGTLVLSLIGGPEAVCCLRIDGYKWGWGAPAVWTVPEGLFDFSMGSSRSL